MATVLPPPSKRQRLESSEKARIQAEANEIPDGLGSVRVQFIDESTGSATGPAIAVSIANATVKNLETLLNSVQGNVGDRDSWKDKLALICQRNRITEFPTDSPSRPPNQPRKMAPQLWMSFRIFITHFSDLVSEVPKRSLIFSSPPKLSFVFEQYQDAQLP